MQILNQPFDGQLGNYLIENLEKDYKSFTIFSAFAKNSGVLRLKSAIEKFKQNGGRVEAFIGVDAQGTSYESVLNLLDLCDEVYVIHSEQPSTTYHSKIYMFSGVNESWVSIGSNNFTGGGLWTNFETSVCINSDRADEFSRINDLIQRYKSSEYECSKRINNKADVDLLKSNGYLNTEYQLNIGNRLNERTRKNNQTQKIFGTQRGIAIPVLIEGEGTSTAAAEQLSVSESDISERMWVESRALTGGSRNILDLSKRGRIIASSGDSSEYLSGDSRFVRGSVTFFDIEPDGTDLEKVVTINYEGKDYNECVIKFPVGDRSNQSWRIQLKGVSSSGETLYRLNGAEWLCNKILVFEKIQTDYYSLSVLPENELENIMSKSKVVATNGNSDKSKKFGFI